MEPMKLGEIPLPAILPLDREKWAQQLNLSNFINTYYQYRDLQALGPIERVLIIGPGQGLTPLILQWRGYDVSTLDIDETFKPDYLGSVHDMHTFQDGQFDAVIASHVLEHLAVPYLDTSLREIARVGRYALIYLPVYGRHSQVRLTGFKGIDLSIHLDVRNLLHKPDGIAPRYCQGQHFWEIGMRGFRVRDLVKRLSQFFEVLRTYRNHDWNPSRNFVLKSKANTT
jgi:hypothetical protein